MFTYQFKEGDPQHVFSHSNAIVLSEEVAQKLFGDASALNKTIRIGGTTGNSENFVVLQIVGVVENFHFKSLHQPIEPYLFYVKPQPQFNYLVASVNIGQVE
jgi:hypothetical protein